MCIAPCLHPQGLLTQVKVPAPHPEPVGGRLKSFQKRWTSLPGSAWHQRTLQGIPLNFIDGTRPLDNTPFDSATRLQPGSPELEACRKTLQHYIDIGAVEELSSETKDGLWSSFFPVAKKNTNKMRGCLDLRKLNAHLEYEHFKMEGLHTVRDLLRRRDYMTKVDMSDYFFHYVIAPKDRRYFRFMFLGQKFQFTAMPFGLASAPRLATKMLQLVIRHLRQRGFV